MRNVLNNLLRTLWFTIFVYPLDPTSQHIYFNSKAPESEFDRVKRGLYSELKQRYFHFASHFQNLQQAKKLTKEEGFWLKWMEALRKHIGTVCKGAIPGGDTSLAALPTPTTAVFLVIHLSSLSLLIIVSADSGLYSSKTLITIR